ncbi:response regulator [Pedobacter sp. P351]|uniref:response regulator n=1 Tax=Pedobacter superstes TaxID=3133441 RepID=UPI00309C4C4A
MKNNLIAVIDNDELDRYIYKKIILLTCPNYRFIDFSNGLEALNYFKVNAHNVNNLPDIVLLDVRMPFLNGWQYLEKYCEIKPELAKNTRHYVCSASMERFDLDFRNSNLYGYFMKPISPQDVLKIIEDTGENQAEDDLFNFSRGRKAN